MRLQRNWKGITSSGLQAQSLVNYELTTMKVKDFALLLAVGWNVGVISGLECFYTKIDTSKISLFGNIKHGHLEMSTPVLF